MLRVAEAVLDYVEELLNLRRWWGEWEHRQSPVAFWLAVLTAVVVLIVTAIYAFDAWQRIREYLDSP